MNLRILIVDDDPAIRRFLSMTLAFAHYISDTAGSGKEGFAKEADTKYDLILLDMGLPDMNGVAFLRRLRQYSSIPVIVVSAIHHESDKVSALNAGADDYITKPFSTDELIARIQANLRRTLPAKTTSSTLTADEMTMDLSGRILTISGEFIKLTPKEFKLLHIFMQNQGKALTHAWLLKEIWGVGYQNETHFLRVVINRLRQKIETDPARPKWITTESGVGYRFLA